MGAMSQTKFIAKINNILNTKLNSKLNTKRNKNQFNMDEHLESLIYKYGEEILTSEKFIHTKNHIQHGTISVNQHCMDVALCSLKISYQLKIPCSRKDLVRGALLHDYFLYDWHDKHHKEIKHLHGFYHPGVALNNASKDYLLTEREKDIIKKHMWPLTLKVPRCREAWIVTLADKYCSILETIRIRKGK